MKKVILLSLSILLISLAYSFAEVPCKINYQGRLIKDNVPVDGTKTMVFSIYDSAVGPTLLWTSGNVSVEVHNGLFRYVIGSGGTDLSGMDWTAGQTLYLEVEVETEILTPREELSAYPYAINSHLLEGRTKEYFINTSAGAQTKQGNLNIMGNLGIGTNDPKEYLHLHNSGSVSYMLITNGWIGHTQTDGLRIGTTAYGNGLIWLYENAPLRFATNNQDRVRIDKTGNVGIGDDLSPDAKLEIVKSASGDILNISSASGNDGDLVTILNSGNVGIGTTSPGAKLHIGGTAGTDGIMFPDGTLQTTAGGGVFVPTQVSGTTNSCTLPNGLIIKWGSAASAYTVTFPVAFPNACFQVQATSNNNSDAHSNVRVSSVTRTKFYINGAYAPFFWFATGY